MMMITVIKARFYYTFIHAFLIFIIIIPNPNLTTNDSKFNISIFLFCLSVCTFIWEIIYICVFSYLFIYHKSNDTLKTRIRTTTATTNDISLQACFIFFDLYLMFMLMWIIYIIRYMLIEYEWFHFLTLPISFSFSFSFFCFIPKTNKHINRILLLLLLLRLV